jgi:hypothetical protein
MENAMMREIRLTDDPGYRAGHDNLLALRKHRDELQKRIAVEQAKPRRRKQLGDDLVIGLPTVAAEPAVDVAGLQSERLRIDRAIGLQTEVLKRMTGDVARELCRPLAGPYRERLVRLVDALEAVGRAADEVREFSQFYEAQCGLPLTGLPVVGLDTSKVSNVNPQSTTSLLRARVRAAINQLADATPPQAAPPSRKRPALAARGG